ncbi:MAG: hypothetical protein CMB80_08085 [Flammeovirgaceae bacterium]|nr:hypothetical protein [Flammeovirgaceae bacterium]|tara:strand:+ start:2191 stop:2562 length:372 start_codon:yes stop_codon:yes gene_type:complete
MPKPVRSNSLGIVMNDCGLDYKVGGLIWIYEDGMNIYLYHCDSNWYNVDEMTKSLGFRHSNAIEGDELVYLEISRPNQFLTKEENVYRRIRPGEAYIDTTTIRYRTTAEEAFLIEILNGAHTR